MGGVVVLHPQDCLKDQLFSAPMKSRRSPKSNPNFNPPRNPNFTRSDGRKRSPTDLRRNNNRTPMVADRPAAKDLAMGQVKILRRGELLEKSTISPAISDKNQNLKKKVDKVKKVFDDVLPLKERNKKVEKIKDFPKVKEVFDDLLLSSTNRLGPDPEMVPKQKNIADFFAGSGFVDSPPPSSVPLPGFFTKNLSSVAVKGDPTTDLRRILGLNLS